MMNKVALLIGGNEGDRQALIEQAIVLIQERIGTVVAVSKVYETEPWGEFEVESGKRKVDSFLNQALVVETALLPHDVLHETLAIEAELGRERSHLSPSWDAVGSADNSHLSPRKYHSRPMDIDIIFYGDAVIDTPDLIVPHPRMHERRFVLEPLAEIIPDYIHPIMGKSVKELLEELA